MVSQAALEGLFRAVSSLNDKPVMAQAFSDDMTRGIELVATPLVVGLLGWLLDHLVGTAPLFTIVFVVAAVVATLAKMWYGYDAEMRSHEAAGLWARSTRSDPGASGADSVTDLWSTRKVSDA